MEGCMNLGKESETLEFKKTTGEKREAMDDIAAILNKSGSGKLYFGVAPNGEVTGQMVSASSLNDVAAMIKDAIKPSLHPAIHEVLLEGKSVIEVLFSGSEFPYSSFGRYYTRVVDRDEPMTTEELREFILASDYSSSWEEEATACTLEDLDHEALKRFYEKAVSCGRLDAMTFYDEEELLGGLGLWENGHLNNAGYYLFSKKEPAVLKMAVYVSDERINFSDIRREKGNIFNLIELGYSYIKEHLNWSVKRGQGLSRIEVPEIPIAAIREVLVNSFAHANYREQSENEIDITPTLLEIYNPGNFPKNLGPDAFARGQHKSVPRNKKILDVLFKSKDVEGFGSGLKKTYAECQKARIRHSFRLGQNDFTFLFYRSDVTINVPLNVPLKTDASSSGLSETDEKVLAILQESGLVSQEEIARECGKTTRTIRRSIVKLVKLQKLRRIGSRKAGYWEVIG
jgi:ATP-dependent DNA helicase RecG